MSCEWTLPTNAIYKRMLIHIPFDHKSYYLIARVSGGFIGNLQSTCPMVMTSVPLKGPCTEGGRVQGSTALVTTA